MPPKSQSVNGSLSLTGKRKFEPDNRNAAVRKRFKAAATRKMNVQSHDEAFSNGALNVADFVRAREFEIRALEHGIKSSSRALSSRAFQEVPRELRRRTASHNAKRVPKRLRSRALREMRDDNTVVKRRKKVLPHQRMRFETIRRMRAVTERLKAQKAAKKAKRHKSITDESIEVTEDNEADTNMANHQTTVTTIKVRKPMGKENRLSQPPTPQARFRKRQTEKTWLPTHVYHAKRAHISSPKEPLWRFAIPLTPTEKSYRKTHRATTLRGAVAWDTSYMSSIRISGRDDSIAGVLKALGVGSYANDKSIWTSKGSRWRDGSRTWSGWLHKREKYPLDAICPATIIWEPINPTLDADGDIIMRRPTDTTRSRVVLIRCHPSAFLDLWQQLLQLSKVQKPSVKMEDLRYEIGSIEITGPQASEVIAGVMRPKTFDGPNTASYDAMDKIWKTLPMLSNINLLPSNIVVSTMISDPRLVQTVRKPGARVQCLAGQEGAFANLCLRWPLDQDAQMMPLLDRAARLKACQSLPTQKSINRRRSAAPAGKPPAQSATDPSIPLIMYSSAGGNANQGSWTLLLPWKCLLAVWYPLMYFPLSTGGNIRFGGLEELRQISYESQRPWFPADFPGTAAGQAWESRTQENAKKEWHRKPKGRRTEYDSLDLGNGRKGEIGRGWACDWQALVGDAWPLNQIAKAIARNCLAKSYDASTEIPTGLTTVKVTMITRGVPRTRARIYRLPSNDSSLRRQWLALASPKPSKKAKVDLPQIGSDAYPLVPDQEDVIGFVTTGNFNLAEGLGFGIGSLILSKTVAIPKTQTDTDTSISEATQHFLCIVRNSGETFGRIARWELAE